MRILLINPTVRVWAPPHINPMGLGYIAASLLQEGHDVHVYDINAMRWSDEEVKRKIEQEIATFDAVGIGGLITTYTYVKWLISIIKGCRKDIPVIVGDNGATFSYDIYLRKAGADIAVLGEGDITIKEVARALDMKKDLGTIEGIAFTREGEICKTPPRKRIRDLDALPYPAWDIFPIETYINQKVLPRTEGRRSLGVSATRGCPYPCAFCYPSFGRFVTMRSARSIVDEIKYMKKKYRLEYTGYSDDLFIIDKKRVIDTCRLLIDEKVDIAWCSAARVNLVDRELLASMKEAGCNWIGYGIESANQGILDEMKKCVTVDQARRAVRLTKEYGFDCVTSYIVGMPSETPDSIEDTVRFILDEDLAFCGLNYATPYPGSELFEYAMRAGMIKDEERFLMSLGDANVFLINLTKMPDTLLVRLKESAEDRIWERHGRFTEMLLRAVPRPIGFGIRLLWLLRYWGLRLTLKKIARSLVRTRGGRKREAKRGPYD